MDSPFEDSPFDVERLLIDAVKQILSSEDYPTFMAWIRGNFKNYLLPGMGLEQLDHMAISALATAIGRSFWNATPLPRNNFRTLHQPPPGRNAPCDCGSGRKYKRCCGHGSLPPHMESDMIWPVMAMVLSPSKFAKAIAERLVPLEALMMIAEQYQDQGKLKKAVALLEPVFKGKFGRHDDVADYALNHLCDLYDELGFSKKKMLLLEGVLDSAPRSSLRSGAWQRLAAIRNDAGDREGTWEAFRNAMHDDPGSPHLSHLELQLLLSESQWDKAKDRARFWTRKLSKLSQDKSEGIEELFRFLTLVVEDPKHAMARYTLEAGLTTGDELLRWLEGVKDRSISHYKCIDLESLSMDGDDETVLGRLEERLKGMGIGPKKRKLAAIELRNKIQAMDADAKRTTPPAEDVGRILQPPEEIVALEVRWKEVFPLGKPTGTNTGPMLGEDIWDAEVELRWVGFLKVHPEAFDSLDILDDLATAVLNILYDGGSDIDEMLLVPLLERSMAIIGALDPKSPDALPWSYVENRPALRSLARAIEWKIWQQHRDEVAKLVEWYLRLNPNDNHGFRGHLINWFLHEGEDERAVALADRYSEDFLIETAYGQVLALYRLGHLESAAEVLQNVVSRLPVAYRYLIAKRVRKPKVHKEGVEVGGEDQAWFYRQEMLPVWDSVPGLRNWLECQEEPKQARKQGHLRLPL